MNRKKRAPQFFKVKEVDTTNYQIRFVLSSPAVDRSGEVIDQNGWDLTNYLKNPVVLWGHDQSIPAVGKIVDGTLGIVQGNLEGVVQFAYNENPDAAVLFDLYAGGYMNAGSVGFMNKKWMYDETKDMLTLLENELYEFSLVNVPANQEALAKAMQKGIDISVVDRLNKIKKLDERFKDLGEEEKGEVNADEEEKPAAEIPTEEEEDEEIHKETPPEKTEGADEAVKAAVALLINSSAVEIKAAVEALTEKLKDANKKEVDTTPTQGRADNHDVAKKTYYVHDINRVARSLMSQIKKPAA